MNNPRSTVGKEAAGQPPIRLVPYLGCAPWLRTVGRKKRDLREEKSHTKSQAKQDDNMQKGPRRRACRSLCGVGYHRFP